MHRTFLRVAVVTMLAVLASGSVLALATPAGATTRTFQYCTKVSGNMNGAVTFKGSRCHSKPPAGYGNVTISGPSINGGGPLFWRNGTGDQVVFGSPTSTGNDGQSTCATNWTLDYWQGTVTATSADPYDQSVAGDSWTIRLCVNNVSVNVKGVPHEDSLSFTPNT